MSSTIFHHAWQAIAMILFVLAENPVTYMTIASSILGMIYIRFVRGRWYQARVDDYIHTAFMAVENMKNLGQLPAGADKAAIALEHLQTLLGASKITMSDEIAATARISWAAIHAQKADPAAIPSSKISGFSVDATGPAAPAPAARRMGFITGALAILLLAPSFGCLTISAEEAKLKTAIAQTPSCAGVTLGSELDNLVALAIQLAPELGTLNVQQIMDTALADAKNINAQCLIGVVEYMVTQPTVAPPAMPKSTALAAALAVKGPAKVQEALAGIEAYSQHVNAGGLR